MNIVKIREWLERNKIFFDVTAAVLIGIASLVVSVAGYRVNKQTLLATEMSSLPYFFMGKRGDYDQELKKFVSDTLVLSNGGAPATNVDWSVRTFLVVERSTVSQQRLLIPLMHYYTWLNSNLAPTGEVATFAEPDNLLKFSALYHAALSRNEDQTKRGPLLTDYIFLDILRISTVRYDDRFGQEHSEYFRDFRKVSAESVLPLLKYAETAHPLDLDDATLQDVIQRSSSIDNLFIESVR